MAPRSSVPAPCTGAGTASSVGDGTCAREHAQPGPDADRLAGPARRSRHPRHPCGGSIGRAGAPGCASGSAGSRLFPRREHDAASAASSSSLVSVMSVRPASSLVPVPQQPGRVGRVLDEGHVAQARAVDDPTQRPQAAFVRSRHVPRAIRAAAADVRLGQVHVGDDVLQLATRLHRAAARCRRPPWPGWRARPAAGGSRHRLAPSGYRGRRPATGGCPPCRRSLPGSMAAYTFVTLLRGCVRCSVGGARRRTGIARWSGVDARRRSWPSTSWVRYAQEQAQRYHGPDADDRDAEDTSAAGGARRTRPAWPPTMEPTASSTTTR